ncbi:hypothetical protein [Microbacterium sp.]|uniref:hypothetical protein n=1 Tax=Microbacterium sp. TaxID=51671 RepID=UPI0039E2F21E
MALTEPSFRLSRRAWWWVEGIVPVVGVVTIAAVCAAVAVVGGPWRFAVAGLVVVLGIVAGLLLTAGFGAERIHARVAAARSGWARSCAGATMQPDGPADQRDIALALPRGWRVVGARGRVRFDVDGVPVRAETWVLRAAGGSRRAPARREVVRADAITGDARLSLPIGAAVDPLLVTPAGKADAAEPVWAPAVRVRVAGHRDMLATLSIGDGRVILFALDDPRHDTMMQRAALVRDVAGLIG